MGGNVFEYTQPINKEHIGSTLREFTKQLNIIFPKIDFNFHLIGSTGKKDVSNDIDVALSESIFFTENDKIKWQDWSIDNHQFCFIYKQIRQRAKTATVKQSKLRALIKAISYKLLENKIIADPKNSGSGSLFCCFPQYNEHGERLDKLVQIDINIGNLDWLNFSYYSEVYEGNIKGLHRTQLLVALFAYKDRVFRHGTGIWNPTTKEYEAKTPDEAITLLSKLYGINFSLKILNNFFNIMNLLKYNVLKLPPGNLEKIYDIYLKILDSTKTDIPYMLQNYWKENQLILKLEGKFLPKDSLLYEWLRGRK